MGRYNDLHETNKEKVIDRFFHQIKKFRAPERLYIAKELLDAVEQSEIHRLERGK